MFSVSFLLRAYRFVISGCVWSSSILETKSLPEASRYGLPEPIFPCGVDLTHCFQLMGGKICAVEAVLSQQPQLKVLRDPPSLAGQRVRCVMVFHFDSGETGVARCKVRAQAWTDPSLHTRFPVDNEMSAILAEGVFHVAKIDFEKNDPDKLRAGDIRAASRQLS